MRLHTMLIAMANRSNQQIDPFQTSEGALHCGQTFPVESRSEAPKASGQGTETLMAKHKSESLAGTEQLMEEVCERENGKQALQRVKANKASPGVDGMTVDELPEYLKQHGLEIGEQLRNRTYQPQPVKRVEIAKPDGNGVRKLGIPCVLDALAPCALARSEHFLAKCLLLRGSAFRQWS
jgi:hypothetical protein